MTVLVTGATGRVGSRLIPRLIANGVVVRALVRDSTRASALAEQGAEFVVGDLRDQESVETAMDGVEVVLHLGAAFRGVSPEEAEQINNVSTVSLAEAAVARGVRRFVFTSTNLVYGPGRGRPAVESDELLAPASASYPSAKLKAERALQDIHEKTGLDLRILRLAFVYGDGDPHLREAMRWARNWPAHKRLHMVHHADVFQAVFLALRSEVGSGRAFNVADDAPVTTAELFELNRDHMPEERSLQVLDDPWEGIVSTRTIRSMLGFRPFYPTVWTARSSGCG